MSQDIDEGAVDTDEQLADIEQLATPTAAQYIPPTGTLIMPMLERRGKTRVTFTPDERRAKARKKAKNRSKRKASQRARKGARR